jgi:hypothetical protein
MAQAVKCLLCNREALNSNPSPTKKKKVTNIFKKSIVKTIG